MSLPHVILVPGLMCDAAVWEHQARTLQTLTTVEIPDHGMNDSLEGMARSLLARAPARFALAGHSMGSAGHDHALEPFSKRAAGLMRPSRGDRGACGHGGSGGCRLGRLEVLRPADPVATGLLGPVEGEVRAAHDLVGRIALAVGPPDADGHEVIVVVVDDR